MTVPDPEIVGEYELRVVKNATRGDDALAAGSGVIGSLLMTITEGFGGWLPLITRPRWLVLVRRVSDDTERVAATRPTLDGALKEHRRIRQILDTGDTDQIEELPDIDIESDGFRF